jgi:hypothetical protein
MKISSSIKNRTALPFKSQRGPVPSNSRQKNEAEKWKANTRLKVRRGAGCPGYSVHMALAVQVSAYKTICYKKKGRALWPTPWVDRVLLAPEDRSFDALR